MKNRVVRLRGHAVGWLGIVFLLLQYSSATAGQFDGWCFPANDCTGEPSRIEDDTFSTCEAFCTMSNQTKVGGLDASLYTVTCEGDHLEEPSVGRTIFMSSRSDQGETTTFAIDSNGVTELIKCPNPQPTPKDAVSVTLHNSCLADQSDERVTLVGNLDHQIFPGPPRYEDVTKGDVPEPTYILHLDRPICVASELGNLHEIDRIHVYAEGSDQQGSVWSSLRMLIGSKVAVVGEVPFPSHTGHHHAPAVMAIDSVSAWTGDLTWAYGTAATTVQAFYEALAVGDGLEASSFIVPEKRSGGPLSADSLTQFYKKLKTPLRLLRVTPKAANEFSASYMYEVPNGSLCSGESVVKTTQREGRNLIASITAIDSCSKPNAPVNKNSGLSDIFKVD